MIYTTQQLMDLRMIPEWLGISLAKECECGCPILNNADLTFRWCMNPSCYYHMQHKADEMFKHLGVKGVGPATCLAGLKKFRVKNHFELIPKLIGDFKPKVNLWEIADMAGIQGYGKVFWEKELAGKRNFEQYFSGMNFVPRDIQSHKDMLINAQQYFDIKPPLSSRYITVMLNGSIAGFNNREHFVDKCNELVGQYLRVRSVGVNQSSDYCVTENYHSNERKVTTAKANGIPVLKPDEFLKELTARVKELIELGEKPIQ